ncbi:MAG: response regulator [Candidatus Dadabacteria bacterium]|nr:MAG: response regulator [Candidatus Dadabacteria bacterium]
MSRQVGIVVRDPRLRDGLVRRFREAGARTVESDAALDALNWLQDEHLDALVADLHLEDMHGDDLLRDLRQEPGGAALPVVMLVDHEDDWFTERCLEAGASKVLPYDRAASAVREVAALLRIDDRIETPGKVRYYIVQSSSRTRYRGRVGDVSASGIAFQADECDLEAGFIIDMQVALPELEPFMARGEVVRVKPPNSRGIYRIFVRWQGFRKGDRPRLLQWIRERAPRG